jgi:hypothetical protein
MQFSPILAIHIAGGTVGFLSGAIAIFLRKGSRRHALAGNVFTAAMLTMAASAVVLATMKRQTGNILGGGLTFYLIATAWLTARRREQQTGFFDWPGLLTAVAVAAAMATFGIQKVLQVPGAHDGVPAGMNFFLASVVLLAALGDIRMLVRGGIIGTRRVARHLWRMCFGLFIASGSIFLGRAHLFPAVVRKSGVLFLLTVFPLLLLIFWLVRLRLKNADRSFMLKMQPSSNPSAQTAGLRS